MIENKNFDRKSLRFLKKKNIEWNELAKDCVCFANARGGYIFIGIEDGANSPPKGQKIVNRNWPEIIKKNIENLTVNVRLVVSIETTGDQSEYIKVQILPNKQNIASTTDGKYYIRVHDECRPIPPDEMARLAAEKNAFVWEEQITKKVPASRFDEHKRLSFLKDIRNSSRVSRFVKEMSDEEILEHYFFQKNGYLTNLGILWIGRREDRATLLYPPVIQVIRYDEEERKIWKLQLDDYSLNPKELLERVMQVSDWQESFEISEGMYRRNILFYPLEVVRELVVNALVHRTYSSRGDIFINIFPDRMEIHSPGLLPYGVTPSNILTQSVRRNEHLSKVFYDLGLMEKEGSGYDLVYVRLLGLGKPLPEVKEMTDRVTVIVKKRFINTEIVRFMDRAINDFSLRQKEIIALGILSQRPSFKAVELSKLLNQNSESGLRTWLGRLLNFNLIVKTGKGKGTRYSLNREHLKRLNIEGIATNNKIETVRLEKMILEDLSIYPNSSFSEIHKRIGMEISQYKIKRVLGLMVKKGLLHTTGQRRWMRYSLRNKNNQ